MTSVTMVTMAIPPKAPITTLDLIELVCKTRLPFHARGPDNRNASAHSKHVFARPEKRLK